MRILHAQVFTTASENVPKKILETALTIYQKKIFLTLLFINHYMRVPIPLQYPISIKQNIILQNYINLSKINMTIINCNSYYWLVLEGQYMYVIEFYLVDPLLCSMTTCWATEAKVNFPAPFGDSWGP